LREAWSEGYSCAMAAPETSAPKTIATSDSASRPALSCTSCSTREEEAGFFVSEPAQRGGFLVLADFNEDLRFAMQLDFALVDDEELGAEMTDAVRICQAASGFWFVGSLPTSKTALE